MQAKHKELSPLPPSAPRYKDGYVSPSGVSVEYVAEHSKRHLMEEDGLCTLLYHHLHKNNKGREHALSSIFLPETIVYEHNFPRAWYAYDVESKEIVQRPSKQLDAQTIYDKFSVAQKGCPIVAQFFYATTPVEEAWDSILTPAERRQRTYKGQGLTYVEFFTAESLRHFLFQIPRKPDGALQAFVVPKGDGMSRRNFQLQVLWSPLITTVYRRTNHFRLDDHTVPAATRAATYDGAAYLSEETLVADETKREVNRICRELVDHFYATEKKHITRLSLYFKTDDDNRMWLLWCSCVRVGADVLHPSSLEVPVRLDLRTEVVNDGSTSVAKMMSRRSRQKNLLALDYALFEVSRDQELALAVNASHKRQAKALGLAGLQSATIGDDPKDPRCNPRHPLHAAFLCVCEPSDVALEVRQIGSEERPPSDEVADLSDSAAEEDTPEQQVRDELVALAMDAWYEIYSTTLSEMPSVMPTAKVELASPLVTVLTAEELERLTELLGIVPAPEVRSLVPVSQGVVLYTAVPYLIGSGRRLDRPSTQVEVDVANFFTELFRHRGVAITRACLEKHPLYFA